MDVINIQACREMNWNFTNKNGGVSKKKNQASKTDDLTDD